MVVENWIPMRQKWSREHEAAAPYERSKRRKLTYSKLDSLQSQWKLERIAENPAAKHSSPYLERPRPATQLKYTKPKKPCIRCSAGLDRTAEARQNMILNYNLGVSRKPACRIRFLYDFFTKQHFLYETT